MSDPLARTIAFQSPQQRPRECVWNLSGLGSFSPPPQAFRDWLAYFPRIHIVCCLKRFFLSWMFCCCVSLCSVTFLPCEGCVAAVLPGRQDAAKVEAGQLSVSLSNVVSVVRRSKAEVT